MKIKIFTLALVTTLFSFAQKKKEEKPVHYTKKPGLYAEMQTTKGKITLELEYKKNTNYCSQFC